jgi:hypothetical protein
MRVFIVVLLALFTACGERRKFSLEGTWVRGGISGDHFGAYVLRIREDASGAVTGTACRLSSGFFIFGDRPVRGQYPYVILDQGTSRYTGGIVSTDEIIGTQVGETFSQEWIFQRVDPSAFEGCLSAPRPPGAPR